MAKETSKTSAKRRRVTFTYESQSAGEVILMGDFNQWDQKVHPMKNNGKGLWKKIVMLYPGRHEYRFLVDGQWRNDPNNALCPNDFGSHNNILEVR